MQARIITALVLSAAAATAWAQSAEEQLGWDAEAELGAVSTSGNSKANTVNARLKLINEQLSWRHRFEAQYLTADSEAGTTAERYVAEASSNYKLSQDDYLIVLNVRYVKDRFAGLDYRLSESVGYGHRFRWPKARLDLEFGLGGRQTRFLDGERENEEILRLAGNYVWAFSETGEFQQNLFSEIGELNTHSESETALKLRLNGHLATKISYKIIHDSTVPPGTEGTDTITSVNLVYDF